MTRETDRPFDYIDPTPLELEPFLGDSWAICRNTPANRERYKRCITPKQYAEAQRKALDARGYARPAEKVIRDLIKIIQDKWPEDARQMFLYNPVIAEACAILEKARTL